MDQKYGLPGLNDLAVLIHHTARAQGFYDEDMVPFDGKLMNVVGEVAEALEEWRHGRGFTETYWKIGPLQGGDIPDLKFGSGKTWARDYEAEAEAGQRGMYEKRWTELTPERLRSMPNMYGKIKPEGIPTELADIIIRVLDLCGAEGIDIEGAISDKMAFNAQRPWRYGGKRS